MQKYSTLLSSSWSLKLLNCMHVLFNMKFSLLLSQNLRSADILDTGARTLSSPVSGLQVDLAWAALTEPGQ